MPDPVPIIAMDVLLLDHEPPGVVFEYVAAVPSQKDEGPEIAATWAETVKVSIKDASKSIIFFIIIEGDLYNEGVSYTRKVSKK